jgi:hypothetical protein
MGTIGNNPRGLSQISTNSYPQGTGRILNIEKKHFDLGKFKIKPAQYTRNKHDFKVSWSLRVWWG